MFLLKATFYIIYNIIFYKYINRRLCLWRGVLERERSFHNNKELKDERSKFTKLYSTDILKPAKDYFSLQMGDIKGKRILDYGCGNGEMSLRLSKQGAIVTGIDISSLRIEEAKFKAIKENLDINFQEGSCENTGFEDKSFDLIVGTGILHHLDYNACCKEIKRLLKDDGKAIFIEPTGTNIFINMVRNLTPNARSVDEHPLVPKDIITFKKYFNKIDITYSAGLSLMSIPFIWLTGNEPKYLLGILNKMDRKMLKSKLFQNFAWFMVLEFHP